MNMSWKRCARPAKLPRQPVLWQGKMVRPGVSTKAIDQAVHDYIVSQGAKTVVPELQRLPRQCVHQRQQHRHPRNSGTLHPERQGTSCRWTWARTTKGFHGDCAATYACVRQISTEAQKLIDVTRQSFFEGIRFAKKGMRVQDISTRFKRMWSLTVLQLCVPS